MRETIVHLDSEEAFNTGMKAAVADNHRITRVRMASTVHSSIVQNLQFGRLDNDIAMKILVSIYDPDPRAGLKHGDECGTLYGAPVVLDDSLAVRHLVLESVPY